IDDSSKTVTFTTKPSHSGASNFFRGLFYWIRGALGWQNKQLTHYDKAIQSVRDQFSKLNSQVFENEKAKNEIIRLQHLMNAIAFRVEGKGAGLQDITSVPIASPPA